jgi:hypothetical protein
MISTSCPGKQGLARLIAFAALALMLSVSGVVAAEEGVVRVNSVVVAPTKSLAAAEAKAKRIALAGVVKMRGNKSLRKADVDRIMSDVDRYVATRLVLNRQPVKGRYQPAFYFNVDMNGIDSIVQTASAGQIQAIGNPRVQVAIVIRRLPKKFDNADDREAYIDDVNTTASDYFNREGFSIVGFTNLNEDEIYAIKKLNKLEKRIFDPTNKPSAVDYYLLGQLDAPRGSVKARDGGAYYKANIKLMLHFWDFNSGQVVESRRTVEGTGEDARGALDDALANVVKHIAQKANAPAVIKRWQQNMRSGMKYEVGFCEANLQPAYFDHLIKGLEAYGAVSGAKSDQMPLRVFTFPGGKPVDPAKEFQRILNDFQTRTGHYMDTTLYPVIYNKHKVFLFGNSPNCYGGTNIKAVQQ